MRLISHRHHPIALIRYLYPDTIYLSFETVSFGSRLKFIRTFHPSLPSLRDSASKGPIRGKRVTVVARHSSKPRQVEAWHASLVTHCGYAQDAGTRCVDMEWIDGGRGCSGGKLGCIEFDP